MDLSLFLSCWYLNVSCVHCPPSCIFVFVIVVQSNRQTPVKDKSKVSDVRSIAASLNMMLLMFRIKHKLYQKIYFLHHIRH